MSQVSFVSLTCTQTNFGANITLLQLQKSNFNYSATNPILKAQLATAAPGLVWSVAGFTPTWGSATNSSNIVYTFRVEEPGDKSVAEVTASATTQATRSRPHHHAGGPTCK